MTDQFDPLAVHPSVIEAASWRLCSELARRHPHALRIVELHPGGGQYDCLALVAREPEPQSLLHANRVGSIHANPEDDSHGRTWAWAEYLTAREPRHFLLDVEQALRLDPPPMVPAATPWTLSWRAIASALASEILGVSGLRAMNGMLDTSGWEGGPRAELFEAFPGARDASRRSNDADLLDQPAYRFWFLLHGDEPCVAVESDSSRCWWRDGTEHHLYEDYTSNRRRLATTVARCLAPAIP